MGYVISITNQTVTTFNLKFPEVGANPNLYQGLIGSSGILGLMIGSLSGGQIMQKGRLLCFILGAGIAIFGSAISIIPNVPCILIGRLIFGTGVGLHAVSIPRYLEETAPFHLYSFCSPLLTLLQGVGALLTNLIAEGLPPESD